MIEQTAPQLPTWHETTISTNGVRLHAATEGEQGPLVVLLHGFPECWYSWRQYLHPLAQTGFRAVAPDMRGYNLSDKPRGVLNYQLPILTSDVMGLIQSFGEQKAIVVGHDWGGVVAWRFAMDYPEAVEKLVVCNAPHPARMAEELRHFRQVRKSWYVFFFQLPWLPEAVIGGNPQLFLERGMRGSAVRKSAISDDDVRFYAEALRQPGAATAAINYYRALARWGRHLPLRTITAPTLLIWGEEDIALGLPLTEGNERFVPNLRVHRIPNCGHWVQQEAADEVERVMLDFLRQDTAGGSHQGA
ncbi:MAG TPA: alpha/beta hydrolase [Ktedonobacterales bacterium]|nr:alpha/beta hydrolase [Ktedonobacterales bacterium]